MGQNSQKRCFKNSKLGIRPLNPHHHLLWLEFFPLFQTPHFYCAIGKEMQYFLHPAKDARSSRKYFCNYRRILQVEVTQNLLSTDKINIGSISLSYLLMGSREKLSLWTNFDSVNFLQRRYPVFVHVLPPHPATVE